MTLLAQVNEQMFVQSIVSLGADVSNNNGIPLQVVVGVEYVTGCYHQVDISIIRFRDTCYSRRVVSERTAEAEWISGAIAIDDLRQLEQVGDGSVNEIGSRQEQTHHEAKDGRQQGLGP